MKVTWSNYKVFAVSDTHFGHEKIITLANRPFSSVEEMNETLVSNWNSVVSEDDLVVFGGDFMWKKKEAVWFDRLNGAKHLVVGNHDHSDALNLGWVQTHTRLEVELYDNYIVFDHYPLESWNKQFHGSVHFYGHTHKAITPIKNRVCMCVEETNYTPLNVKDVLENLK